MPDGLIKIYICSWVCSVLGGGVPVTGGGSRLPGGSRGRFKGRGAFKSSAGLVYTARLRPPEGRAGGDWLRCLRRGGTRLVTVGEGAVPHGKAGGDWLRGQREAGPRRKCGR